MIRYKESILNFIKREQQKARTKTLNGRVCPKEFEVSASMLFKDLQKAQLETLISEAIESLHELIE